MKLRHRSSSVDSGTSSSATSGGQFDSSPPPPPPPVIFTTGKYSNGRMVVPSSSSTLFGHHHHHHHHPNYIDKTYCGRTMIDQTTQTPEDWRTSFDSSPMASVFPVDIRSNEMNGIQSGISPPMMMMTNGQQQHHQTINRQTQSGNHPETGKQTQIVKGIPDGKLGKWPSLVSDANISKNDDNGTVDDGDGNGEFIANGLHRPGRCRTSRNSERNRTGKSAVTVSPSPRSRTSIAATTASSSSSSSTENVNDHHRHRRRRRHRRSSDVFASLNDNEQPSPNGLTDSVDDDDDDDDDGDLASPKTEEDQQQRRRRDKHRDEARCDSTTSRHPDRHIFYNNNNNSTMANVNTKSAAAANVPVTANLSRLNSLAFPASAAAAAAGSILLKSGLSGMMLTEKDNDDDGKHQQRQNNIRMEMVYHPSNFESPKMDGCDVALAATADDDDGNDDQCKLSNSLLFFPNEMDDDVDNANGIQQMPNVDMDNQENNQNLFNFQKAEIDSIKHQRWPWRTTATGGGIHHGGWTPIIGGKCAMESVRSANNNNNFNNSCSRMMTGNSISSSSSSGKWNNNNNNDLPPSRRWPARCFNPDSMMVNPTVTAAAIRRDRSMTTDPNHHRGEDEKSPKMELSGRHHNHHPHHNQNGHSINNNQQEPTTTTTTILDRSDCPGDHSLNGSGGSPFPVKSMPITIPKPASNNGRSSMMFGFFGAYHHPHPDSQLPMLLSSNSVEEFNQEIAELMEKNQIERKDDDDDEDDDEVEDEDERKELATMTMDSIATLGPNTTAAGLGAASFDDVDVVVAEMGNGKQQQQQQHIRNGANNRNFSNPSVGGSAVIGSNDRSGGGRRAPVPELIAADSLLSYQDDDEEDICCPTGNGPLFKMGGDWESLLQMSQCNNGNGEDGSAGGGDQASSCMPFICDDLDDNPVTSTTMDPVTIDNHHYPLRFISTNPNQHKRVLDEMDYHNHQYHHQEADAIVVNPVAKLIKDFSEQQLDNNNCSGMDTTTNSSSKCAKLNSTDQAGSNFDGGGGGGHPESTQQQMLPSPKMISSDLVDVLVEMAKRGGGEQTATSATTTTRVIKNKPKLYQPTKMVDQRDLSMADNLFIEFRQQQQQHYPAAANGNQTEFKLKPSFQSAFLPVSGTTFVTRSRWMQTSN